MTHDVSDDPAVEPGDQDGEVGAEDKERRVEEQDQGLFRADGREGDAEEGDELAGLRRAVG